MASNSSNMSRESRAIRTRDLPPHALATRAWAKLWLQKHGYEEASGAFIAGEWGLFPITYNRLINDGYYDKDHRPNIEHVHIVADAVMPLGIAYEDILEAYYYPTFAGLQSELATHISPDTADFAYITKALAITQTEEWKTSPSRLRSQAAQLLESNMPIQYLALTVADLILLWRSLGQDRDLPMDDPAILARLVA